MQLTSRPALVGAAVAAVLALNPSPASADNGNGHDLIREDLVPSLPTDQPINGVAAGGAPWVLDRGEVRVRPDGRMDVRIEGLQIPRNGGEDNPVASINAILYCSGLPAADSGAQPLSVPEGDARFRVFVDVPEHCDMATVLISPSAAVGRVYIASAVTDGMHDGG